MVVVVFPSAVVWIGIGSLSVVGEVVVVEVVVEAALDLSVPSGSPVSRAIVTKE